MSTDQVAPGQRESPPTAEQRADFGALRDVRCPVSVILGTGTISVRQCLTLAPRHVLRLEEQAGDDVQIRVGDVPVARAEVVIFADSTAVRLTEMLGPTAGDEDA